MVGGLTWGRWKKMAGTRGMNATMNSPRDCFVQKFLRTSSAATVAS